MRFRKSLIRMLLAVCLLAATANAGLRARAGIMSPQGDLKESAKLGWRAEIGADLNMFSLPFMTVAVSVSAVDFGKKESEYNFQSNSFRQESHVALTGGGAGLRVRPPSAMLRPFAELLLRLASVEQEYKDGAGGSSLESKTKFGYEINAGFEYQLAPKTALEFGASYLTLWNHKLIRSRVEQEIDLKAWGVFAGINLGIGL